MCEERADRVSFSDRPSVLTNTFFAVRGTRSLRAGTLVLVIAASASAAPSHAQTCRTPNTSTTRYVDCRLSTNGDGTSANPWNSIRYAAEQIGNGTEVRVRGPATCREQNITIQGKTDVRFTTEGRTVKIVSSASGDDGAVDGFRIFSPNTRIEIGGFHIDVAPTPTPVRLFNQGVLIDAPSGGLARDVSLRGLRVRSATTGAGIVIQSGGGAVCLVGTAVVGAGNSREDQRRNGYFVRVPISTRGTLEALQFIGSLARGNSFDGFAIEHSPATGVVNALFDGASARDNEADGFDVDGGTTVLLNITSSNNGTGVASMGRGVAAAASAHIENAHIVGNTRVGINAESPGSVLAVISSTLADNDRTDLGPGHMGQQIQANGPVAYVYNTIGDGPVFIAGPAERRCGRNV